MKIKGYKAFVKEKKKFRENQKDKMKIQHTQPFLSSWQCFTSKGSIQQQNIKVNQEKKNNPNKT